MDTRERMAECIGKKAMAVMLRRLRERTPCGKRPQNSQSESTGVVGRIDPTPKIGVSVTINPVPFRDSREPREGCPVIAAPGPMLRRAEQACPQSSVAVCDLDHVMPSGTRRVVSVQV